MVDPTHAAKSQGDPPAMLGQSLFQAAVTGWIDTTRKRAARQGWVPGPGKAKATTWSPPAGTKAHLDQVSAWMLYLCGYLGGSTDTVKLARWGHWREW